MNYSIYPTLLYCKYIPQRKRNKFCNEKIPTRTSKQFDPFFLILCAAFPYFLPQLFLNLRKIPVQKSLHQLRCAKKSNAKHKRSWKHTCAGEIGVRSTSFSFILWGVTRNMILCWLRRARNNPSMFLVLVHCNPWWTLLDKHHCDSRRDIIFIFTMSMKKLRYLAVVG